MSPPTSTSQAADAHSAVHLYEEESHSHRLSRKTGEAPFFPIAIGVCTAAVIYGAYQYKNRGKMSTSVYLMQLRVGAQGLAVGTLMVGLGYTMARKFLFNSSSEEDGNSHSSK